MASNKLNSQKEIAAALTRLNKLELNKSFDPLNPKTRPTPAQQELFDDLADIEVRPGEFVPKVKYRFVLGGNQCLAKDTEVLTPSGIVKIQDIRPGDIVYDENGHEIKVKQVFSNGLKEVADLSYKSKVWGSCTEEHTFLIRDGHHKLKERKAGKFIKDDQIKRIHVKAPLGPIHEPHAYVIAALLGDGCSRQSGQRIQISSGTPEVPAKCAEILHTSVRKLHAQNHTWRFETTDCAYYHNWCKGRYAHEKIVDLEVLKTWNRESLLQFVAGLIDTDGTIHPAKDHITLSLNMQAKDIVDAFAWAILTLFQVPLNRLIDSRAKYKNGPVYGAYTRNGTFVRKILEELNPYIVSPQKKYREEYATLGGRRTNPDYLGLKWGTNKRIIETYDIHVDSSTNLYMLANGLITHNSGKTSSVMREVAWVLNDNHPTWTKPTRWGDEPLLILVAGQDRKNMETVLWNVKLKPFLKSDEWREVRVGSMLQFAEHKRLKHRVVFLSHNDSSEASRQHAQGYSAHMVILDEMPRSIHMLEELQRRVDAKKGYFIAAFTPKVRNDAIRKLVDSATPPYGKKYKLSKLDNPLFAQDKDSELAQLNGLSEARKRTILYGDWETGDDAVYNFTWESMVVSSLPQGYQRSWRHTVAVDPALKSKFGYTLWAEDPSNGVWYLINDEYMTGDAILNPDAAVDMVQQRTKGYNIVKRISDPEGTWFITQAQKYRISWVYPNKKDRKAELIKNLQLALSSGKIKICSWCTTFIDEIQSCQWSETSDKIINSSSYHTMDCSQYFIDLMPKYNEENRVLPWEVELRRQNEIRKIKEKKEKSSSLRILNTGRISGLRSARPWK